MRKQRFVPLFLFCLLFTVPAAADSPRLFLVVSPGQSTRVAGDLTGTLAGDGLGPAGLDKTMTVVRRDSEILAGLTLPQTTLPLLALVQTDAGGRAVALDWSIEVVDASQALRDLYAYWDARRNQAWISRSALLVPNEYRPLEKGEVVTIDVDGTPEAQVTATVGGQGGIRLQEVSPGSYRGTYTVTAEDRTDAEVSVQLQTPGSSQSAVVGRVPLQGLPFPKITRLEQYDTSVWVVRGTAPPDSTVRGTVSLPGAGRTNLQTTADDSGRFESRAYLGGWVSSREGTAELRAMDAQGNTVVAPEQKVWFESKQAYRPSYQYAYPTIGLGFSFGYPRYYYPWGYYPYGYYRRYNRWCR